MKFENPGSRGAAVFDDTERDGLMVATRSGFGFGCLQGLLSVSLIRSPRNTQPNLAGSQSTLENPEETATLWDLGTRRVSLAVGRYRADAPRAGTPAAVADALFNETLAYDGEARPSAMPTLRGNESLVPARIRPLESGCLIRLHETLGRRGTCTLEAPAGKGIAVCDTAGDPVGDAASVLEVTFRPYQLLALRVMD